MINNCAELFREGFKITIDYYSERGFQASIADKIGISRQFMSDFVNGRKMLSEEKRESIAKYIGYSYPAFLRMCEDVFADELAWQYKPDRQIPIDKSRLENIIRTIEATEGRGGGVLSPKEKTDLILDLYFESLEAEEKKKSKKAKVFDLMKYKQAA